MRIYYPRFSREALIGRLRLCAEEISRRIPLKLMVLFGSYASGRYTTASDVDLLIVYRGLRRDDAYSICWDILDLSNAEIRIYSEEEYDRLKRSGSSIIRETESKGITIWSDETLKNQVHDFSRETF